MNRREFLGATAKVGAGVGAGLLSDGRAASGSSGKQSKSHGKPGSDKPRFRVVAPNTSGGGVSVEMAGSMGEEHSIGGWPNLVKVANGAMSYFNEIADPAYGYMAYVGGTLGFKTQSFVRSEWDWVEAASYGLPGRIAVRRLTGNISGKEIEIGQRKLTLASFHNLDGFANRTYAKGWSENTYVSIWEQSRVMFTLMSWFLESEDERLLSYMRGILQALMSVSRKEGRFRRLNPPYDANQVFGNVAPIMLVEPLLKYHEVTGDKDAFEFCEGTINWVTDPATNFVDEKFRFSGWLRSFSSALASVARFAAFTSDDRLLDYVENTFRTTMAVTTAFGGTPGGEPCCENMELTTTALALVKSGREEWWDMVDRFFRNHTLACQYTDSNMVNCGYIDAQPGPFDDTRDVLKRALGGFSFATSREHNYDHARLMLCCGGNAMWTMGKIVSNAATQDARGLTVNLHFSLDTPLAAITNHEPFEGKLEVTPHSGGTVRIRKPSYATDIKTTVGGVDMSPRDTGRHLVFDSVAAGSTITLRYPLPERTTEETTMSTPGHCYGPKTDPIVSDTIRTTWRGNTVLAIDYSNSLQPKHRLYVERMDRFRRGEGRNDKERFFQPDKKFDW